MDTHADVVLTVENLCVRLGPSRQVRGVSFQVRAGDLCRIVGDNGTGKTSLMNAILGPDRPCSGQVRFRGTRTDRLSQATLVRRGAVRLYQRPRCFRSLSVDSHLRIVGASDEVRDRLLEILGLHSNDLGRLAAELSYGQLRVLNLVMLFALRPIFAVLDEPYSGLSSALKASIAGELRAFVARGGSVLLTSHPGDAVASEPSRLVMTMPTRA
jgi:ABC-type branched-subunit amino acid transport system ATPase component